MDKPRRSGLREARRDRGWTQEEAADQLARLAWVRLGERVGVNADMIAKWEHGEKNPSPRYRELLCLLYGATPEYLGIARVTSTRTSPSPATASPAVTERSLVDALGGAAAILDQLGTAGGILQPRMFDAWKDDMIQRRITLKLMGIMPAVTALPSVSESARRSRSGKPTPKNVGDLGVPGRPIPDAVPLHCPGGAHDTRGASPAGSGRHHCLQHLFPYLPQQPGYNKLLRNLAPTISGLIGMLARDTTLWTDDVWVIDSTPVECARSREAVHRSELAGWAEYGYGASHSRYFWGLRLHLLATLHSLPVGFTLTGAKADERTVLLDILHTHPTLSTAPSSRPPWPRRV